MEGDSRRGHSSGELLAELYDDLRIAARSRLRGLPQGESIGPTELVHETFADLAKGGAGWDSRGHFYVAALTRMQQILVNRYRRRRQVKRGRDWHRVTMPEIADSGAPNDAALDSWLVACDVLRDLKAASSAAHRMALLRAVAGMTLPEAAEAAGCSLRSAERHWAFAKAFLSDRLQVPPGGPA